ncbi:sensor histidine kinase [Nonomuraea gerenzanensis]|uniref:sensor histidine kinase n=1 Tax=Nonomuraea gerenzanensis TaxID=93944 RepID=UPI001CD9C870|nr:sensor histidine kinase [Nonomuraea gerenzanensis]UBU10215.1 sensor histidine kinase [Nonomuraea gerenzanensis]
MRQPRSIRNLDDWVRFADGRPPLVFSVFFWGSAGLLAVNFVAALRTLDAVVVRWPLLEGLFYAGGAALLPVVVLWPLLPWQRGAPPSRKALTVAFLAAALVVAGGGGLAGLLMVGIAVGNALVVLGGRGAVAYCVVTGLAGFAVGLLNPGQDVLGALINGTLTAVLCLVLLVLVLALFAYSSRAEETSRLLADLEQAHAELAKYAARSRELAVAEERARIARDMHDSVGHYLTVINVGLQNAQRYRTARPEAAWDEVRQAQELTLEALTDTRRWVRALKPLRMDGRTGPDALRALAESFGSADTGVAFRLTGAWPDVDEGRELVCYRVVQEGLTNALRHSGARHVEVALDCTDERVEVTVSDDGSGAEPDATHNGFGLHGLRERLRGVGGELDVTGGRGRGFTLRATVPV